MPTVSQRSFAGGEISPSLHARVDMTKYQTGLKTCRNFVIMRHGGAASRPGTIFTGESPQRTGNQGKTVWLVEFSDVRANATTHYFLEVGEGIFYVWKDNARIAASTATVTNISNASGAVVTTSAAHGFSNGDVVSLSGVAGMTEVNGRDFIISAASGSVFTLNDMRNVPLDSTAYGAYGSGGSAAKAFELWRNAAWDYTEADFSSTGIQFRQVGQTMYISSGDRVLRVITKGATDTDWSIAAAVFGPDLDAVTVGGTDGRWTDSYEFGAKDDERIYYKITALNDQGVESNASAAQEWVVNPLADRERLFPEANTFNVMGSGSTQANLCRELPRVLSANLTYSCDISAPGANWTCNYVQKTGAVVTVTGTFVTGPTVPAALTDCWYIQEIFVDVLATGRTVSFAVDTEVVVAPTVVAGAGNLELNGAGYSQPVPKLTPAGLNANWSRQITFSSVNGNFTSVILSVAGTDQDNTAIVEELNGPNVGQTKSTVNYFRTVTKIEASTTIGAGIQLAIGTDNARPYPVKMHWTGVVGATQYRVYKSYDGGAYGYIGTTEAAAFTDNDFDPDFSNGPPVSSSPISASGDRVSAIGVMQQRFFAGRKYNSPSAIEVSRLGEYMNFDYHRPTQEDDAISFAIAGGRPSEVRHFLDLAKSVIMTSEGEWVLSGNGDAVSALSIAAIQHGYRGSSRVPPVIVGGNAIFLQSGDRIFRDLGYTFQSDNYTGNDLTVFSEHLFRNYTFNSLCYEQRPHSIVWTTRNDGTLLGLTYLPEHQIWGWHRHDTEAGLFKFVASVSGATDNVTYAVVSRTVDGASRTYIERLSDRYNSDVRDYICCDAALTYNGFNGAAGQTMTLTGGTSWDYTETLTLTSSASYFSTASVGNQIHIYDTNENLVLRFNINSYVSATVVRGKVATVVPVGYRGVAVPFPQWAYAVDVVSGLYHLEGFDVAIYGDGNVESSPNNPNYPTKTVTNGSVALGTHYALIQVGLPLTCDLETLNIDQAQGESFAAQPLLVQQTAIFVEESRGIWVGPSRPQGSDSLSGLRQLKIRQTEGYEEPTGRVSGAVEVLMDSQWNENGRVFIRQVDPVPLVVTGVMPTLFLPGQGRQQ